MALFLKGRRGSVQHSLFYTNRPEALRMGK